MQETIVRAYAKINLAIDIKGKREDGYHELDRVTVPLKLHDSIEIFPLGASSGKDTYLYCDDPTIICDESNLAYKALDFRRENHQVNGSYQILIHKRIPVRAGLGGGSADAAAVRHAVEHYNPSKEKEEIEKRRAVNVSSDVPFCLLNKPCRVQGKGEILTPIEIKDDYHVLIVKPKEGLSTKSVFEAYDLIDPNEVVHPNIDALRKGLREGKEDLIQQNRINVLSLPAIKALPLIGEILKQRQDRKLSLCGRSGTGSACYALSKDKKKIEAAYHFFEQKGYEVYSTQFLLG